MPGTTRELTSASDFPRADSLTGTEVLPGVEDDGAPIGVPVSLFRSEADAALDSAAVEDLGDRVTALEAGGTYKAKVEAAATANVALTGAYTVDGETLSDDDRYLAPAQTDPAQNGIYIYNSGGAHARATDMDAADEVYGAVVYVSEGAANGGTTWRTDSVVETLDTDDIDWVVISDATAFSAALATKADAADGTHTGTTTVADLDAATGDFDTLTVGGQDVLTTGDAISLDDTDLTGETTAENLTLSTSLDVTGVELTVDDDALDVTNVKGAGDPLAALAKSLGGPYFDISKCSMWQEASLTASTPAVVGDPVGLIAGLDGKWFAVAKDSDNCGLLSVDTAGNFYIDGAGTTGDYAAYFIKDKDDNFFNQTFNWTIVFAGAGTGRIAGFEQSLSFGHPLQVFEDHYRYTNVAGGQSGGNVGDLGEDFDGRFPWVLRFKKDGTAFSAFMNGEANPRHSYTTYDDSAAYTFEASLLTTDSRSTSEGGFERGRFYGVFWVPSAIDDELHARVAERMSRLNDPRNYRNLDKRPVVLDKLNDEVLIMDDIYTFAEAVTAGFLTDNGGDSFTLNFMRWYDHEYTIIEDIEDNFETLAEDEIIHQTVSENEVQQTLYARDAFDLIFSPFESSSTEVGNAGPGLRPMTEDIPRQRGATFIKPRSRYRTVDLNGDVRNSDTVIPLVTPPSAITINFSTTRYEVLRMAFYPGCLSYDEVKIEFDRAGTTDFHFNGDSFVAQNLDGAFNSFLIDEGYDNLRWTADGAGGLGFHEPGGGGHAQRYLVNDFNHSKVLLISDGGYGELSGDGVRMASILSMLNANFTRTFYQTGLAGAPGGTKEELPRGEATRSGIARAFFLEPNPMTSAAGTTARDNFEIDMDDARRLFNKVQGGVQTAERYIPNLEALFCVYDEFGADAGEITTNKALVAQGRWPENISGDGVHWNTEGKLVAARTALGYLIDNEILEGTTTLPAAPTNLAVDGGGILTWDRVEWADAGNHAIRGYRVYKDGVEQASQQTISYTSDYIWANGGELYGKQYIREFDTGVTGAGTYTVSAITSKGEGAESTGVVVS